ncbi:MAG: nucleotide pyrophosphohydrolase [Gammaproteobacteria bacterium]|nr:nucleotide pyrophosphohydrolase [Gammaproteobacteria bacterium]
MINQLRDLKGRIRRFAEERNWEQYHSPKNLAMALVVETAELVEHFQWLTQEESRSLSPEKRSAVEAELADILIYLVRIADKLDIDLYSATIEKLQHNADKYPVEKVRGLSKKYTEYPE